MGWSSTMNTDGRLRSVDGRFLIGGGFGVERGNANKFRSLERREDIHISTNRAGAAANQAQAQARLGGCSRLNAFSIIAHYDFDAAPLAGKMNVDRTRVSVFG